MLNLNFNPLARKAATVASGTAAFFGILALPFTKAAAQSGSASLDNKPVAAMHDDTPAATTDRTYTFKIKAHDATDPVSGDKGYLSGNFAVAHKASKYPDASKVGVYIMIGTECEYTTDEIVNATQQIFDAYGVPAVMVVDDTPVKDKIFTYKFYTGGKVLRGGQLMHANEFINEHPKVMREIYDAYLANQAPSVALKND